MQIHQLVGRFPLPDSTAPEVLRAAAMLSLLSQLRTSDSCSWHLETGQAAEREYREGLMPTGKGQCLPCEQLVCCITTW